MGTAIHHQLYRNTPPICNAVPCWLQALEKGKRRNTPPICTAVRLLFVLQYASYLYRSTRPVCTGNIFEKMPDFGGSGKFLIGCLLRGAQNGLQPIYILLQLLAHSQCLRLRNSRQRHLVVHNINCNCNQWRGKADRTISSGTSFLESKSQHPFDTKWLRRSFPENIFRLFDGLCTRKISRKDIKKTYFSRNVCVCVKFVI